MRLGLFAAALQPASDAGLLSAWDGAGLRVRRGRVERPTAPIFVVAPAAPAMAGRRPLVWRASWLRMHHSPVLPAQQYVISLHSSLLRNTDSFHPPIHILASAFGKTELSFISLHPRSLLYPVSSPSHSLRRQLYCRPTVRMKYTVALAALAAVVAATPAPQAVTSQISPSASAPAGCQTSYPGSFTITTVNATTSRSKVRAQSRDRTICGH